MRSGVIQLEQQLTRDTVREALAAVDAAVERASEQVLDLEQVRDFDFAGMVAGGSLR